MPTMQGPRAGSAEKSRAQRLYLEDSWTWSQEQANALRRHDWDALDLANVIEEISAMGRTEQRRWNSLCANVIEHLLKIEYQPDSASLNHWRKEINTWRDQMCRTARKNPGMQGEFESMLTEAWLDGRADAVRVLSEHEAGDSPSLEKLSRRQWKDRMPVECPYSLAEVIGYIPHSDSEPQPDVWPASIARILNANLATDYPVSGPSQGSKIGQPR